MKRERAGFTLVELLVVVVIIGMLVGLLVPAVISARERARQGVCINRLKELATATLHYESARGQFPGWRNRAPLGDADVSWVVVLLPYLGREDLWQEYRDGVADGEQVFLEQLACPSDAGNNAPGALNYVGNRNLFRDRSRAVVNNPSQLATNTVVLERLQSAQRTVMISERVNSVAYPVGQWHETNTDSILTFAWDPLDPPSTISLLSSNAYGISSNHGGLVHIAFADGHVDSVPDTTPLTLNEFSLGPIDE